MFDIGFWELIVVAVVALLVVGPERLPGLAREVGLWVGKAKRLITSVRADIERELEADELRRMLHDQQSEIQELKGMISDTRDEVQSELQETERRVKSTGRQPESDPRSTQKAGDESPNERQAGAATAGQSAEHEARSTK